MKKWAIVLQVDHYWMVPRHFLDGHISDGHFLDGQILDRAISGTLFRQVKRMGHFSDRTYFRHIVKVDTF